MARLVVVDDTDSNFRYSGDWSLIDGADYARQGNFGAPYRSSLHRTTAGEASFSYSFDGSAGKIYGTINVKTTNEVTDPTWECKVDNTIISLETPFRYTENNWVLCKWDESTISSGRHTVTVTAKSNGQAFLFDYFLYTPSPGTNVQNAEILVPFNSPDIKYESGWVNLGTDATMAPDGGAVMTFPFYGTGITWVGTIPRELPQGSTSAEYAIDGQTTTFQLVGNPGSTTQYFQKYFQVSGLPLRTHTLQVTSRGRTSLTPLVLQNVIIQGGSLQEPKDTDGDGNTGGNSGNNGNKGNSGSSGGSTSVSGSTTQSSTTKSAPTPGASSGTSTPVGAVVTTDSKGSTITSTPTASATNGLGQTVNSDADSVNPTDSTGSGTSIGPIIGGVVGGILVILIITALLFYRRRRARRSAGIQEYLGQSQNPAGFGYTQQAQPFYTDAAGGSATSYSQAGAMNRSEVFANGAVSGSAAVESQRQMVQTPGTGASYSYTPTTSKRARLLSESTSDPFSGTDTNYYGSPSSSSGLPLGQTQTHHTDSRPLSSSVSAYTSSASVAASSDQLLLPVRGPSKFHEAFGYSEASQQQQQQQIQPLDGPSQTRRANMVITHEDSGYRMPQPSPPPTEIIEYPPMYTPS